MEKYPDPNERIIFTNSESIELVNDKQNEKFKLTISYNSKFIQFFVEDLISFPKNEYIFISTLDELKKINRYFLLFENTKEAYKALLKSSKNKNLKIIQEKNICKISIYNQINDEEFSFEINIKENDKKNESFMSLMKDMRNKIELLEKENINLKEKNNILENKIIELEKRIIVLENKNNNITIQKKNKYFQSNIINENNEKIILNWIPNKENLITTELIFDTSRDGDSIDAFKMKCEGKCPTLVIVKTTTGIIFGGYATSPWKEDGYIEDYNSFVFSLEPERKYNLKTAQYALYGYRYNDIMFQFGCCYFRIGPNCTKNNNNFAQDSDYEEGLKNIIKGNGHFQVSRLEIFKLNF
jgi:hypothetical protein